VDEATLETIINDRLDELDAALRAMGGSES